jgi:Type II secretion system (T2SS), protein E, N-terminal domain
MTAMPTLEELLVQSRLISAPQLAIAQRDAQTRNRRLAPTLIDLGLVNERRFAEWMSEVSRLPIIDPLPAAAVESLVRRIPRMVAREYEILPLSVDQGALVVAMINPLDIACLDVLRTATAMSIRPVIAVYGALLELLSRFYPKDASEATLMMTTGFDPSATLAFPRDEPNEEDDTNPVTEVTAESQLDRIEHAVTGLRRMVERLQERIDAIDGTLEHILSRG